MNKPAVRVSQLSMSEMTDVDQSHPDDRFMGEDRLAFKELFKACPLVTSSQRGWNIRAFRAFDLLRLVYILWFLFLQLYTVVSFLTALLSRPHPVNI